MITITKIGIRCEPVDIKVNTLAKFRYDSHGDMAFFLELDGSDMYTTYITQRFSIGSIRLAAIKQLIDDIRNIPEIEGTREWKGCRGYTLYNACITQAKNELCNPLHSNRAREIKEEIIELMEESRSTLARSRDTLETIFSKYENFTVPQDELRFEAEKWETKADVLLTDEVNTLNKIKRKLQEYIDIRGKIFDKTVRHEHLFTVNIDE